MNENFELQFEIEPSCLLDCVHCSSLEMREHGKRGYSDSDIVKLLEKMDESTHVYFTGGEPLLYKELLPLCRMISSSVPNTRIGLYTTGNMVNNQFVSEAFAMELVDAGVEDCFLSVYSDCANEHDTFTNFGNSFNNTISTAINLKKAGIQPKAHLVLNKLNIEKIDKVINFCASCGFEEVRLLKLTPSGRAVSNWSSIGLELEVQNDIIKKLIADKKSYQVKLSFSGYPLLYPCRSVNQAKYCQAGIKLLYVTLSGAVYPCACTTRAPDHFMIGKIYDTDSIIAYLKKNSCRDYNNNCLNEQC